MTAVEVSVLWQDRVLNTRTFRSPHEVNLAALGVPQKLLGRELTLSVKRVPASPRAAVPPWFDLGSTETAGVLLALLCTLFMASYTLLGSALLREESQDETKIIPHVRVQFRLPQVSPPVAAAPTPAPPAAQKTLLTTFRSRGLDKTMAKLFDANLGLAAAAAHAKGIGSADKSAMSRAKSKAPIPKPAPTSN